MKKDFDNEKNVTKHSDKKKKIQKKSVKRKRTGKTSPVLTFWKSLCDSASEMSAGDRVIASTGVIVLIMAIITGSVYVSARNVDDQVAAFAELGEDLGAVSLVGESGLIAVTDAEVAAMNAEIIEEPEEEEGVSDEDAENEIQLNLTSVQKDLKIKFLNRADGRLISGIAFQADVKGPDGRTTVYEDDDKDGIIYQTDLTPGEYEVALVEIDGLEGYKYSTDPVSIKVKDKIEYTQIDVADEIKTEDQVDVAKEDTASQEAESAPALQDTVEWVESTKTAVGSEDGEYEEIDKDDIPDPSETSAAVGRFRAMSQLLEEDAFSWDEEDDTDTASESEETDTEDTLSWDEQDDDTDDEEDDSDEEDDDTDSEEDDSDDDDDDDSATVTLNQSELTLLTGSSSTLTASVSSGSVKWSSDDESVAKVENGKVTAIAPGKAVISAVSTEDKSVSASCKVTVTLDPKSDTSSRLKDQDGNQVYIEDDGEYAEATYADYYTADKFYKKLDNIQYKYTGWQTIDGKTYFYDKNGNPVTGEQVIQGAKYTFGSDGALASNTNTGVMGIDVSKWNGTINWTAVKNSGVNYVIIRCGYRGSSTGALIEDPNFKTNIQGATAAGIKVGVYFFTQALNEVEAVEEASMALNLIKGHKLSYPVFIDVESSGGRADGLGRSERTAVINAFCKTIQNGGYTAGVYANKTWLEGKMNASALSGYKIWLAQYASEPSYTATRYDMWQYTSKGTVGGISGSVDMNLSYLGY